MKTENKVLYPNPTIIEAICEFHFSLPGDAQNVWDGKWFGHLHSKLGDNYEMEPKTAKSIIVQADQGRPALSEKLIPINHMLYKHKTKDQLIQLAPWLLTFNEIGSYPGWEIFLEHIKYGWKSLTSIIDPIHVKRIGMRYINRIPRASSTDSVGDWVNKNDLFPKRLLDQYRDFFFRCEIPHTDNTRIIVTLTEEQVSQTIKPIIFDIDTSMIVNQTCKWDDIQKFISLVHNVIRKEFDSSLTERLEKLLNQIPPKNE